MKKTFFKLLMVPVFIFSGFLWASSKIDFRSEKKEGEFYLVQSNIMSKSSISMTEYVTADFVDVDGKVYHNVFVSLGCRKEGIESMNSLFENNSLSKMKYEEIIVNGNKLYKFPDISKIMKCSKQKDV